MENILRIVDRFEIVGGGIVYTVEKSKDVELRIGDIYEDLRGNRFKVNGIEMFRMNPEAKGFEDASRGVMFESVDGVEVCGTILFNGQQKINILFCNHPLYSSNVDEDYKDEYEEAKLIRSCALFSYEDLLLGKLSLYGNDISGLTIYRGWMMKPAMYRLFYKLLEEKGIFLINTPEEYEYYHMLPNWYEDFKEDTAFTLWETEGKTENILMKAKGLEGSYIIKDYVKSRKHEWYDACFIKDISDKANATKVISNFENRQGEDLVGGLVLRKFENLKQIGFHEKSGMPISEEYRVFIYAGHILIIDDYWREGKNVNFSEKEKKWMEEVASTIKSNFITMDLARREDGSLIIMELGDGQVSGIQQINPQHFYFAFEQGKSIPVEQLFSDDMVILAGDPIPNKSVDEIWTEVESITSTKELVDVYVNVYSKFWIIEDKPYDYEEGTEEFAKACDEGNEWNDLMNFLDKKVFATAEKEGLLAERKSDSGTIKQLEEFMNKYGYKNSSGWWIKIKEKIV